LAQASLGQASQSSNIWSDLPHSGPQCRRGETEIAMPHALAQHPLAIVTGVEEVTVAVSEMTKGEVIAEAGPGQIVAVK